MNAVGYNLNGPSVTFRPEEKASYFEQFIISECKVELNLLGGRLFNYSNVTSPAVCGNNRGC